MQFHVDHPGSPALTLDVQPYGLKGYVVTVSRALNDDGLTDPHEPQAIHSVTNRSDLVQMLRGYGVSQTAIDENVFHKNRQPRAFLIALTISTLLWTVIAALVYLIWRLF